MGKLASEGHADRASVATSKVFKRLPVKAQRGNVSIDVPARSRVPTSCTTGSEVLRKGNTELARDPDRHRAHATNSCGWSIARSCAYRNDSDSTPAPSSTRRDAVAICGHKMLLHRFLGPRAPDRNSYQRMDEAGTTKHGWSNACAPRWIRMLLKHELHVITHQGKQPSTVRSTRGGRSPAPHRPDASPSASRPSVRRLEDSQTSRCISDVQP